MGIPTRHLNPCSSDSVLGRFRCLAEVRTVSNGSSGLVCQRSPGAGVDVCHHLHCRDGIPQLYQVSCVPNSDLMLTH